MTASSSPIPTVELVRRLRHTANSGADLWESEEDNLRAAADRLEALEREVERMNQTTKDTPKPNDRGGEATNEPGRAQAFLQTGSIGSASTGDTELLTSLPVESSASGGASVPPIDYTALIEEADRSIRNRWLIHFARDKDVQEVLYSLVDLLEKLRNALTSARREHERSVWRR